MRTPSLSSVELLKSDTYVPRAIGEDTDGHSIISKGLNKSLKLSRNPSHVTEIGRIILGIRDDRDLEAEQYVSYRNNMDPETVLTKQLSSVADGLIEDHSSQHEDTDLESIEEESSADSDYPVDGKFAFWQAILIMLMIFLTWGTNAAFGIFLNYYLSTEYFPGASKYDFALMGGVVVFLAQFLGPFTTLAVNICGQTPVLVIGICIQTLGYFLAAQCTQLWQIFMCQGVMVGISFALIFIPGTLVIPTWFDKWKALAMGIAVSGSGLGGLVYSLALNSIIERTGNHRWALRTAGIINLVISVFGTVFLRARNKQKVVYKTTFTWTFIKDSAKVVFDFKIFKSYPLFITGIWFGFCLIGYVIVLYSFAAVATSIGLSRTQSSNILAILNALQVVGRPVIGNFGDSFGRNNTSVFFCFYLGIMLTAFWLNARTYAETIVLGILVGSAAGIGSLMAQSLAYDVLFFEGIPEKIPAAWGGLNIIVSVFSLPAEVIALKLQTNDGPRSYRHAQIFTACSFFFAGLLMLVNREWLIRQTFMLRRKQTEEKIREVESEDVREKLKDVADNHGGKGFELEELLRERIQRYDQLLGWSPGYFFLRMFYPIKV